MSKERIDNLKITILGCGSSGGVPRVGGDWGACDPLEPKNARSRCSILVEYWQSVAGQNDKGQGEVPGSERTVVLVDTSPDLRRQLLDCRVDHIDALIYTHDHGDQTNGIDDLRAIAYRQGKRIPTHMGADTKQALLQRFGYCFEMPEGRVHAPILEIQDLIADGDIVNITGPGGDLAVAVFEVGHGNTNAFGFVFCHKLAYTPDVHTIHSQTLNRLENLDIWILDALRYHSHPTHSHMDKALIWGAQTKTKKLIFTNMHIDMDYQTISSELLGEHEAAFDGMIMHWDNK